MQKTPGEGEPKWGWAPALLLIFVTFALGWASAGMIADILGIGWLSWPLRIGFLVSEAMVIAWLFEPQKGYYTEEQMAGLEFAKWVILGAGLADGVLMILIKKFGGGEGLVMAQAIITLGAIFIGAGASMWLIKKDPNRIVKVHETTINMRLFIEKAKLSFEKGLDELETLRIELNTNRRARRDLNKYVNEAINGDRLQGELQAAGEYLALGIVQKYNARVRAIAGLSEAKPAAEPLGELQGASEPQQKRRILGIPIPFTVDEVSGDGAPRRG